MKVIKEYTNIKAPITLINADIRIYLTLKDNFYQVIILNAGHKDLMKLRDCNNAKDIFLDVFEKDKTLKLTVNEKEEIISINDKWKLK